MRTLILGIDSFDPRIFEQLSEEGLLPNLTRLAETGGYAPFEVSAPPQTEVSWTSIATGLNPGGHGIFDFVHRNPKSYTPYVSLLPTKTGALGTLSCSMIPHDSWDSGFKIVADGLLVVIDGADASWSGDEKGSLNAQEKWEWDVYYDFIDAVREGRTETSVPYDEGIRSLAVSLAGYKSVDKGGSPVDIEELLEENVGNNI